MIKELLRIIENEEPISFFLGAGVSLGPQNGPRKGLGSGKDLASFLAEKFSLPDANNLSLMSICDECSFINESRFREILKKYLEDAYPQDAHTLIVDILSLMNEPQDFLLTVNVDDLLEQEYRRKKGKSIQVAKKSSDIYVGNSKSYLKIHGCVSLIEDAVFTTKDYLKSDLDNRLFDKLRTIFAERSIVFIGFSMQDIDILRILFKVCPCDGFKKPNFWVVPKGNNWSEPRTNFYLKQFNLHHLDMNAVTFLNDVLNFLQKKKARDDLISELINSDIKIPIPINTAEVLIENVNQLDKATQVKLLYKCLISKKGLQEQFYSTIGNISKILEIILELLKTYPEFANSINISGISLVESQDYEVIKPNLISLADYKIPNFYNLLLKFQSCDDSEWVKLLFKIIEDSGSWSTIMEVFNANTYQAIIGLMRNNDINVLTKIKKYYTGEDSNVNLVLDQRINQIKGMLIKNNVVVSDEYKEAIQILKEQDLVIRTKYSAVWTNIKCDERNTCRTDFLTTSKIDFYKQIDIPDNDIERALVGTGLVLAKNKKKTYLHLIGQNIELDLDIKVEFLTIAHDHILCFTGNLLYIYDFNGGLISVELLSQNVALPPKSKSDGTVIYIGKDDKVYSINTTYKDSLLFELNSSAPITDFIICDENIVVAAGCKLYLKTVENLICAECTEPIKGIVSDNFSIYAITRESINSFNINNLYSDKRYDSVIDIDTSVVAVSKGLLVFGFNNKVVTVNFNNINPSQSSFSINGEECLLDIILCDSQLIAIGKSGLLYFINQSDSRVETESLTNSYDLALLSAGSGVICVRTENALLLCRNIA